MEEEKSTLLKFFEHIKGYAGTISDITRLTLIEKGTGIISGVAAYSIVGFFFLFFLFFGSFAMAYVIAGYLGRSVYIGFSIEAVFYFILSLVLWWMRKKWLQIPISNLLVKEIFKEKDNHE